MFNRALKSWRYALIAGLFVIAAPAAALAARGYTTTSVNMRAGPGTAYPVVAAVPGGANLTIYGCLNDNSWCDVNWSGNRGWISADHLDYFYNNQYVYLPDYIDEIDVPVVTFVLGTYWNNYYAGRPWYHRRAYWDRYWRGHGRYGHNGGLRHRRPRPGVANPGNRPGHHGVRPNNPHVRPAPARHERPGRPHRGPRAAVNHAPVRPHAMRRGPARVPHARPHGSAPHMGRMGGHAGGGGHPGGGGGRGHHR